MNRSTPDPMTSDPNSALKQTQNQQTFLGLPVIVVRLVLDLLDRNEIYTFRLVSRACRRLSEPVIFGTLVFRDLTWSNVHKRLCNSEDALKDIVHHVRIGPLAERSIYPTEIDLTRSFEHITDLRDFSWHMKFPIPKDLLRLLHTKHTSARIHIVNRDRDDHFSYLSPDFAALSSPQLHSLDYTAYGVTECIAPQEWEFYSEIPAIKKCLLKARNLKCLRLHVSNNGVTRQDFWTAGPKCFSFEQDEIFPTLQEIRFDYEKYAMREEYCRQWAKAMDWTKLRRLDLDHGSPENLLAVLTGRVPQLKVLHFGFWPAMFTWGHPNAKVFQAFSDSIEGLEEVVANNLEAMPFDEIRDAFVSKHGHSLKKFHVSYGARGLGWDHTNVENLAQKCPGIRNLTLKIMTEGGYSAGWPEATMKALQGFKYLRTLELTLCLDSRLQLSQDSTELLDITYGRGGSPHFYLKEVACEEHIVNLYRLLAGDDSHSIDSIKVIFRTNEQYNEWVYTVQTQSRSGRRFQVDRDFSRAKPGRPDEVTPAGFGWDPFG